MKRKKLLSMTVCALLMAGLLLGGCAVQPAQTASGQAAETPGAAQEMVTQKDLAAQVQEKYEDGAAEYADSALEIGRDESLSVRIGFDPEVLGMENYTEIVGVYQDAKLTQRVGTHFNWDKETGDIEITPPVSPILGISTVGLPESGSAYRLYDRGELKDWGNAGKLYFARYVDLETGETLEKPLISVVRVRGEIGQAPQVRFVQTDDGCAAFQWQAVDGAEKYYVVKADYDSEGGYTGNAVVVGETTEPYWQSETDGILINQDFRTYRVSEDDWLDESMHDYYAEDYTAGDIPVQEDSLYQTRYGVIAVNSEGSSMISNTFDKQELAALLPYVTALNSGDEDFSNYASGILSVPSHRWIVMCDGRTVQRIINYDFDAAEAVQETWGEYENEDMSDLRTVQVDIVRIPYTIEGTPFTGVMKVEDYDPQTLEADLAALRERQDGLRGKTGAVDTVTIRQEEAPSGGDTQQPVSAEPESKVTANSALSEYLARNMLAGAELIDLSDFPESNDPDYLVDAWMEALYQNPLILGVDDAYLSGDGKTMLVVYQDDAETRAKKQQELTDEVKRVVAGIITSDMTEMEKEIAINDYLCETAEYDTAALENAEQYDYRKTDPEYNDSFTPYGVLKKNVGVCASYAGAFKLLADEAGLDCIVVTGYLEGSLSHAWNKVRIDGEWQAVDVTNNDNEILFNAILNLPDYASGKVLVEDDRFVLDSRIANYSSASTEEEYYRVTGRYYDPDTIAQALADDLMADGRATLRTDYSLDDSQFGALAQKVLELSGLEAMNGFYWMGVITLAA